LFGLRGNSIFHRTGKIPLLLATTVSNVITPEIENKKGKLLTGVKAKSRKVSV